MSCSPRGPEEAGVPGGGAWRPRAALEEEYPGPRRGQHPRGRLAHVSENRLMEIVKTTDRRIAIM